MSSFNLSRAGLRGAERGYFQCVSWMAWTLSRQCCNSTEVTQTNGLRQAMRLEMRIGKKERCRLHNQRTDGIGLKGARASTEGTDYY